MDLLLSSYNNEINTFLFLDDSDKHLKNLKETLNAVVLFQCFIGSSSLGSSSESAIGKLFGCEVENSSLCRCGKETVRSSLTLLFTMHYPEQNSQGNFNVLFDFAPHISAEKKFCTVFIANVSFHFAHQKRPSRSTTLLRSWRRASVWSRVPRHGVKTVRSISPQWVPAPIQT